MLSGDGAKSRIVFVRLRRIIRLLFESEFRELVRRKTFRKQYRYAKSIKKKKKKKKQREKSDLRRRYVLSQTHTRTPFRRFYLRETVLNENFTRDYIFIIIYRCTHAALLCHCCTA